MQWYFVENGQSAGPVSEEILRQRVADGDLPPETLVWHDGMGDWQAYATLFAPASPSSGSGEGEVCCECQRRFSASEMIHYEGRWVCGGCKTVFFQRLAEGGRPPGEIAYGGFWIRFAAKFLDGLILGIVNAAMGGAMGFIGTVLGNPAMEIFFTILGVLVQLALGIAYSTWMVGKYGATVGKMACGLRVVWADGGKLSYGRALARSLAEYLSVFTLYIGYIMAAFDSEKRTLHDHICHTRVIKK